MCIYICMYVCIYIYTYIHIYIYIYIYVYIYIYIYIYKCLGLRAPQGLGEVEEVNGPPSGRASRPLSAPSPPPLRIPTYVSYSTIAYCMMYYNIMVCVMPRCYSHCRDLCHVFASGCYYCCYYTHVCVYIYIYIHVHISLSIYIYIYTYVYIYI